MPIELLDIILVVLMLISGLLAMVRGFSREVLSISSWLIAAFVAWRFHADLAPLIAPYTDGISTNEIVPKAVAGFVLFLITLIVVSLITLKIADFIVDSRVGALDRTLGFIFGAFRGALLVVVCLMFFVSFFPENQPSWVANAKSKPALISMGETLVNMFPEDPASYIDNLQGNEEAREG